MSKLAHSSEYHMLAIEYQRAWDEGWIGDVPHEYAVYARLNGQRLLRKPVAAYLQGWFDGRTFAKDTQ